MANFGQDTTLFTLATPARPPLAISDPISSSLNSMLNRICNDMAGLATFYETAAGGGTLNFHEGATGGSTVLSRRENEPLNEGTELSPYANAANYKALVVSLTDHDEILSSDVAPLQDYATRYYDVGDGGAGARLFVQASHVAHSSLGAILAELNSKIASVSATFESMLSLVPLGQQPMRVIPMAQFCKVVYEDQVAATGPTAECFYDLFRSGTNPTGNPVIDVHFGDIGETANAKVTGASLYNLDPSACPNQLAARAALTVDWDNYMNARIKSVFAANQRQFGADTSGWA
jgi:hypothetical protein